MRARLTLYCLALLPVSWRFSRIYRNRLWGGKASESPSGKGSSIEATARIRNELPALLRSLQCKNLLDLGCGDYNWMRHVDLGVPYLGADVVADVVQRNQARYAKQGVEFINLDGIKGPIPVDTDVILCREVLFHLSFRHARAMLANIRRSDARFLIVTQIQAECPNIDIYTGGFRPLDLTRQPFEFPQPLFSIPDDGVSTNRCLAVWRIRDLPGL